MRLSIAFLLGVITGYFLFYAYAPRPDFRSNITVEASQPLNPVVVDINQHLQAAVDSCDRSLQSAITSMQECTSKLMREIDDKEDCDARLHSIQSDSDGWQRKYEEVHCEKSYDEGGYFLY